MLSCANKDLVQPSIFSPKNLHFFFQILIFIYGLGGQRFEFEI